MRFSLLAALFLSSSTAVLAAPLTECSPCRAYGSPFGPGYSYYCYFVKSGSTLKSAHRFAEDGEECRASRRENRDCRDSGDDELSAPVGGDPCPRL